MRPREVWRGLRRAVARVRGSDGSPSAGRPSRPTPDGGALRRGARGGRHPAFSTNALRRAWRRVRANGGGAGVDGIDVKRFERTLDERLGGLRAELLDGSYRPRAVRRVFVPKPSKGLRPLAIWALRDRVAQRAVYDFLEPSFEPGFLDCSHGFRPGRSVDTAVAAVLEGRDAHRRWVIDTDIKDCFEAIDPRRLMGVIRTRVDDRLVLHLLEQWLRAELLDRHGRYRPAGAAQGGVLSPLLCNIYLHPFDVALTKRGIHLVRYADDLVCLTRRKADAEAALEQAGRALRRLRMELHPQKTRVCHFDDGFKFLGVFFVRNEHYYLSAAVARGAEKGR